MGNGVSSPPGGVGPGGTTSSSLPGRHAPPFPSPSIPSSSGSFSSSRISRGARGDNCRSSKPVSASTFSSSAETSSTCSPMQKSCFALALPPLPATFSDSALLPPPASTRSEPPYISPWPPSSPSDGSLSPAPSSPLQHPLSSPSRRASATSTCGGSVPPPHYYGVGVPNSAGGVVVGESRRQFSSQISSYSPCPAHAMGAYGVTGASWGLGLEPGRGGVMPPPSHHQREILGSVSDQETGAVSSPSSSNSTASRAVHSRFPSRAMMFPASCASGTVEETAGVELETEGDARSQTDGICGGEGYDGDDDVRAANKWNDMAAAMKQGDMNFRSVSGHPDLSLPAKAPVNTFFFHSGRMGARQRSLSDDECHIHHASLSAFRNMPAAHNDLRAILTAGGPAPGGAFLPCSQTAFADQLFVLPPSSSLTVNSETPKKDSSPPCQQERDCRDRGTCSHSRGSAWASSATGVATNSSGRGQGGGGGVDGNRKGAAGEGVSSGSVVVRGRSGFPDPTKQSTNPLWFGSTSGMAEGQPATRGSVQRTCRGRGRSATGVVGADAEQFFTSQHMRGRLAHHRSHIVSEVCSERGVAPSVSCGTPPIVTGHPALSAARGGDCSHGISRSSNGSGGGSGSGHRKMGPVSSLQQGHGASGGFPRSDRTGFVDDATKGGISRSSVDTETTTSGVPSSFVGSRGPGRLTNCEGQYSGVVPPFDDTLTCKLDGGPNNNAAPQAFCYTCCARGHVTPLGYPCVAHPRSGMSAGVGLLSGNVVEAASSSARGDLPKQHTSLDPLSGALAQNPSLSSSSLAHPSLTCFSDCSCSNLLLRGGAADVAATPGSAGTRLLVSGGGGGPGPDALVGATEAECRTGLLKNVKIDFPSSSNLPLLGRQKHSTNPKNSGRKKPHHDQHGDIGPRSDNEEGCCPQQNVAPLRSGQESPFTQHTSESEELDETSFACCGSERCLHQSSGIGHGHHPSMPVGHHTVQQGGVLQNGCVSSERGRSPSGSCGVSALESSTAISPCSKTVGCKGVGGGGGGRGSNTAGLKAGDTFLSSSYGDSNHARGSGSHAKGKAASSTSSSSGSRGVGKQGTVADMTDMRDSMENSNDERLRQFSGTGGAAGQRKVPRGEYSVPRGCRSPSGTLGTGAAGAAAMKNILGSGPMNSTCRESTTNNFSTSAAVGDGGEGSSPSGSGSNISGGSGKSCNDSLPGDGNNNNKSGGGTGGGDGGKKGSGGGSGNGSGGNGGGGLSGGSSSSRNRNSGNTKDCQTVDFYVRNFWKVAKTQNDLESPTHGYCRGFAYRLLLHPRGTTGTDSEASHLSVFLEAIRQDWYPDDWIFPNVRFELTVVNFKDPKQSVTSWAHWSFSNEATSRGWQKMISHARLNKQAGFMDEEGTVLVKGKAEPPFSSLWSRGPVYRPHRIWEYIPERAAKALEEVSSSCSAAALALTGGNGGGGINTTNNASNATSAGGSNGGAGAGNALAMQRIKTPTASLLSYVDPIVPALDSSLGADYVALFVHCLFHLCEFRKHIYMWKSDFIKSPTAEQLAQDSSLAAQIPSFADGSLIGALQQTFAYMQLWPVTIACKRLQQLTASSSSSARKEICPSEIWKWYGAELFPKNSPSRRAPPPAATSPTNSRVAFCTLCRRCTCCCRCRSTAYHATAASGSHGFAGQTHLAVGGGVDGRCGEDGSGGRAGGGRAGAGGSSAGTSSTGEDVDMIYQQLKLDRDTCLCCDLMDRYPEMMVDMPPQPNIKAVLKALHMHDVQKMDVPDPLVKVHTELFSLLMRELAKAKLETRQMQQDYQTARHVVTASVVGSDGTSYIPEPTDGSGESENGGGGGGVPGQGPDAGGGLWADVDGVAFTSCDHLEATCHELFSSSDRSTGLLNADGVPDISAGFTRCKHVHSLQKALESCGKVLQHFPEVLFVYLQSVKQCKKGELFDAPLRLDAHKLLQTKSRTPSSSPGGGEGGNNGGNENNTKQNIGGGPSTADREKQRRRLRKKLQLSRKGNKLSREPQEEDSDLTEDEELAVSDEEDSTYDHGEDGHSKAGSKGHANGGTNTGGDNGKGGVAVPGGPNGSGHSSSSSSMSGGMATPNQEKWFSLFALLIREGDSRGDGCGAQTSHYLLLRPEEDGPWFRIGDGRVERLSSKVDFTEWKCHRDFFCAGAVYIAEDYIDAVQAGDVDLSGDLRELNPWLYYRTLYELGITEAEIKRPWISNMNANAASHSPSASGSLSNLCPPVSGGDGAVPRSVSDVTGQVVQPQGVSGIPGTSSAPRASTGGGGMAFDRLTGEVAGGLNASKLGYAGGAGGKREDAYATGGADPGVARFGGRSSSSSSPIALDGRGSTQPPVSPHHHLPSFSMHPGFAGTAAASTTSGTVNIGTVPPCKHDSCGGHLGLSLLQNPLSAVVTPWVPQTLAQQRRYMVLAPVVRWIFEAAVEKAVVLASGSPESMENHYWYVLRIQYLEKILLLELRHALCEVLADEWLEKYVGPHFSELLLSGAFQLDRGGVVLEEETKKEQGGGGKRKKKKSKADDDEEKLSAAVSFFFRDDEEGGTVAASAAGWERGGANSLRDAVLEADDKVVSNSAEKPPAEKKKKKSHAKQAKKEEKGKGEKTKSTGDGLKSNDLDSPLRFGHRQAAEVISRWARTHLSDNGRLIADELGRVLKDPLNRLVEKISTLRHEVEVLCREGRGRSFRYRAGQSDTDRFSAEGGAATAVVPPGESSGVEAVEEERNASLKHRSGQESLSGKLGLSDAGNAMTSFTEGVSSDRGDGSEDNGGDSSSFVGSAGSAGGGAGTMAELQQAVGDRLADLWACCRSCVMESEAILAEFTLQKFGGRAGGGRVMPRTRVNDSNIEEGREEENRIPRGNTKEEQTTERRNPPADFKNRSSDLGGDATQEDPSALLSCATDESLLLPPEFCPTGWERTVGSLPGILSGNIHAQFASAAAGSVAGGGRPPDGLDHLGCEFDIPVDETVELIAFLAEAFWLPDFRTMRRYLRDRKHLVFERVRPHELIRAYLAVTRPEVDLPALLRESGYDVLWCEAAFQPEDISAIWGDTSLPDVAAVQNACKGFYLPHAVSSVLMHLLVTALECRQETDSGSEAVGKKGKKKRGEGEAEGRKRGREGNHLAPAPTEQQLGSIKAATSTSVSEKADREEGHPISADVEAIIRAMEHDCPDLASSTSTAPAPPLPGSPEPGGVVTPPQASGSVPTERPEDSYVSSTNADVSKVRAASEGPTREILSPAPPLLPTHSPPQSVDLGNAAAPSVPIAPPKIPLTLPIPRAADSAPTGGSKAARKKARGSGFASAAAGDPAQLVPVLDQVLPRLSFDQRLAASADPAVFFLCPAASSSAYSSFAPSPKGGSGAAASTGGSAASPTTASGNNSSLSAGPQSISSEQLGMEGSSIAGVHPPGGNGSSGRSPGGNNGTANGAVNGNLCRRLRYHGLEIGLLLAEDLKGLEGFAIEDRLTPRARLVVRKAVPITGMSSSASTPANPGASPTNSSGTNSPSVLQESLSVQRLYWAFRKLLHSQIEERDVYGREDGNPPPGGSSSGTTTTAGGGGGKGAKNNVFESQQYQQQLSLLQEQGERELWWLPTPRDAFLLYALRPDPDPTRRGRRRFVYMDPLEDVESYVDTKRQWIDATAPDIMILLVAAPQRCCAEAAAWLKGNAVASTSSSSVGSVPSLILPPPALTFPLEDAEDFPLLVFKWFQAESVDLFCVGALVCDAKQQLQTYILDWLLPQVRARGYLTPLPPHTTKDDPESYLVLEECHVRTVQNIRRWSCAIRKINKQGGDIIIVQKKGLIESPASIRYRESSALIEKVRLYEVTHHHHHHCAAGVPGGPANGDFDLDALGSSSLPPLASTVSGDPGTGEFLLDGNPDLIPLLHGDAGSGAGGGIFSHLLEEGGDGEDGAAGGKKKKKKKQKKVLPRAAIPSNKKSVIARLAEDQRREETTLLKAAKDNQHEGDRDDLSLQAPSTTTTASSSSSSASISSSTGTGQEGKSKKKSKVAASSENEEGESMTGSKATSAVASKRSEEGGSALSEERGKDEREEDKENQSSNRKMGAGGSSSSAVSKTSIGSSKAVAGDGKTKSGVGSATSAGARTGRKAAGPSFSLSQTKTASFEDERPSLDSSRTPSVELPSGQQLTSVKGRGVGSLEEAARSLSSSAVQKKGKKSGDEKTLIKEIGGSPTFSTSGGITRKKDSGGMSSPLSSAHQTGTSSPPLSPASSTLSRGSFSSLITLPNSVQSRLSSSALQLLQKLADKQHSVTPSFLRETANVLLRDFLRRISRLYQETEEANKETLGQGGSQTSERKRGDDQSNTSGSSSGIGGGDGSASTASWLVSNGGGAGSVIADEVWECVEALETVCCSCFSTQQRPVFVKELQTLLEHEVVQQQDGDAEGMEERKTPKRGGDSVETKPGSSKASGSGPGTGKARRGSYCGVATPGKGASVSTEEASASDWRLAAFQRLFSFRRRAACELFALLSVARGGQIVTRKLVAQYCLAALDRPETSQNSSRALSSVATVIHMWMFLGPRLLCKLGDSQQGRRFVDAGLKKLFDFFQQRASSALQLQSQHPSFSSVSVFSSSTTSPSSNNSAGVLLPVPAPGELDCGSLIAWAAGVLLKVFHLSRSSQLALPRQTEVSNALQQIQLPSAFCSYTKPQSTSTAPSAWSAGAPLVPLIGENSQYSSGAGGGVHQSGSILGGTADGTQHEQKGAHYHGGQGVLDSTVQTGRSGGNPPLLLPPVTGGLSSGSVTFAGWTSASSPADSSSQGGRKSGMLDDSTAGKKGGARERKSPKHLAGSDGGCESPSSAMVSAVDASDGGRAGGRSGGTKGMSSPTSSTGLRGRLVAAIDEREDSEEEESVEEDESGATMVHQEQELLVGEQSVYGSGKALSKRTFKKAAPYVVEEGSTWMVLYKPAFWHCSGFGRDRPVFVPRVATAQELEEALAHISVEDMVTSGKIESFHLYMMKKYPRMETVRRWEEMECGLCHRTDLETSGSLLIAKTRRARESIFEQFRRRLVHKEYLLLCHGRLDKVYARIDHPIATRDFDSNRSKSHFSEVVGPDEGGDEALTEYQVVRVFGLRQPVHPKIQAAMTVAARLAANATSSGVSSSSSSTGSSGTSTTAGGGVTTSRSAPAATSSGSTKGASPSSSSSTNKKDFTYSQEFSFCRVRIHTGRTHQIRVHFRHIGHPLVGDTKYCDLYKCTVDRSWCARMFLHSAVLEFDNPDKVETQHVRVVCPLAAELLGALEHELVCLEDYSKITTDMIDRNGQIKKEHKHLIVQNSTEPPDGSVPGYTALSAVSSPSSRSSGPLSSSSPPLLPLVPSVSAVVGSNTATPGSPASASHTRGSTGGSNAGGASGGAGEGGTCSPPPVMRSSPAASAATVSGSASYENSKHTEGAPLSGSTPAGTSGILSSGVRSTERLHEEEDTTAKPPTPLLSDSHPDGSSPPSSPQASSRLAQPPPSNRSLSPPSPASTSRGTSSPCPVSSPFSSIFENLYSNAVVLETEARQQEGSQAAALASNEEQRKAVSSRTSLLSLVAEGDWSVGYCDRVDHSNAPRGGETSWSYREYAAGLAGLMHLPRKEEDLSGLRHVLESFASRPTASLLEEEEAQRYRAMTTAARVGEFLRGREVVLQAVLQPLLRLLQFSEMRKDIRLAVSPTDDVSGTTATTRGDGGGGDGPNGAVSGGGGKRWGHSSSTGTDQSNNNNTKAASFLQESSWLRGCRYLAFDSRTGRLRDFGYGSLVVPPLANPAAGGGGVTAEVASVGMIPAWKALLELLAAHYRQYICLQWDVGHEAIAVVLLNSESLGNRPAQHQPAICVRTFLEFFRALRDLAKFEGFSSAAVRRGISNAPLSAKLRVLGSDPANAPGGGGSTGGISLLRLDSGESGKTPLDGSPRGQRSSAGGGGGRTKTSEERDTVSGKEVGTHDRVVVGDACGEYSTASLWRMQAWQKLFGGVVRNIRSRSPEMKEPSQSGVFSRPPHFGLNMASPTHATHLSGPGIIRAPFLRQGQQGQPPLLPPHAIPGGGPCQVPYDLKGAPHLGSGRPHQQQSPLLQTGGILSTSAVSPRLGETDESGGHVMMFLSSPQHQESSPGHSLRGGGMPPYLPPPPDVHGYTSGGPGGGGAVGFARSHHPSSHQPLSHHAGGAGDVSGSRPAWTTPGLWGSNGGVDSGLRAAGEGVGGGARRSVASGPGNMPPAGGVPFVFLWGSDGAHPADATPPSNAEVQEEDIRDLMDLSFMTGNTPVSGHAHCGAGGGQDGVPGLMPSPTGERPPPSNGGGAVGLEMTNPVTLEGKLVARSPQRERGSRDAGKVGPGGGFRPQGEDQEERSVVGGSGVLRDLSDDGDRGMPTLGDDVSRPGSLPGVPRGGDMLPGNGHLVNQAHHGGMAPRSSVMGGGGATNTPGAPLLPFGQPAPPGSSSQQVLGRNLNGIESGASPPLIQQQHMDVHSANDSGPNPGENQVFVNGKWCVRVEIPHPPVEAPPHPNVMFLHQQAANDREAYSDHHGSPSSVAAVAALLSRQYCGGAVADVLRLQHMQARGGGGGPGMIVNERGGGRFDDRGLVVSPATNHTRLADYNSGSPAGGNMLGPSLHEGQNSTQPQMGGGGPGVLAPPPRPSPSPPGNMPIPPAHIHPSLRSHLASASPSACYQLPGGSVFSVGGGANGLTTSAGNAPGRGTQQNTSGQQGLLGVLDPVQRRPVVAPPPSQAQAAPGGVVTGGGGGPSFPPPGFGVPRPPSPGELRGGDLRTAPPLLVSQQQQMRHSGNMPPPPHHMTSASQRQSESLLGAGGMPMARLPGGGGGQGTCGRAVGGGGPKAPGDGDGRGGPGCGPEH